MSDRAVNKSRSSNDDARSVVWILLVIAVIAIYQIDRVEHKRAEENLYRERAIVELTEGECAGALYECITDEEYYAGQLRDYLNGDGDVTLDEAIEAVDTLESALSEVRDVLYAMEGHRIYVDVSLVG